MTIKKVLEMLVKAYEDHAMISVISEEILTKSVADLGEGPGGLGLPPPLFWVKKEEMTAGKMATMSSKSKPPPPPPLSSMSGSATENATYISH